MLDGDKKVKVWYKHGSRALFFLIQEQNVWCLLTYSETTKHGHTGQCHMCCYDSNTRGMGAA